MGEVGHDVELLVVEEQLFAACPDEDNVALEAVSDVDGKLEGHVRAFGEVGSNNNRFHAIKYYILKFNNGRLIILFCQFDKK